MLRESSNPVSISVEYTDINLVIDSKDKKGPISRTILENLHGSFDAGKLTAIIGPSGCGKSTLMNVLSGRMSKESIANSKLTGEVSLNGQIVDPTDYKQRFAYVMAEDALYATTTPREAFNFVCKLRLDKLTPEQRSQRTEEMLKQLGLEKCADTYVGSALLKGISSGEKKRTAVGIELLPNPDVVFLDEPTTGLDSYTALELIRLVKHISNSGKTVICVIHQPSSEIYDVFDDVVFMCKGKIVYHGPVTKVVEYFSSRGFVCPDDYNPADYVMYVLQTISMEQLNTLEAAWRTFEEDKKTQILVKRKSAQPLKLKPLSRTSLSTQSGALFGRELQRTFRDPSVLLIRLGITLFLGLVVGFLFWKVGETDLSSSHRGGVTNAAVFAMFGSGQAMLITFPFERPVLIREYSNGLYNMGTYLLSKLFVEIPLIFIQNGILILLIYFLEAWVGNYMLSWLAVFLMGSATACTALAFGSSLKDVDKAVELGFLLFIPQILFSGFFVSIDQIPALFRWAQWLCALKYTVNILYIAEFRNLAGHEAVFDATSVNEDLLGMYIGILVGIIVVMCCLAGVLLKYRSKSVY
jgi:ABC-type multidrug transport system ATPase subunit/ABC-type multidrug transport system permease subunit